MLLLLLLLPMRRCEISRCDDAYNAVTANATASSAAYKDALNSGMLIIKYEDAI